MNAPLLSITVAFMVGVLIGDRLTAPAPLLAGLGAALAVVSLFWKPRKAAGFITLLLLWAVLGMARAALWKSHPAERAVEGLTGQAKPVMLHGVLSDDWVKRGYARGEVAYNSTLEASHVFQSGHWAPTSARLKLAARGASPAAKYGDELLIEASWQRVPAPSNPGQHDQRRALAREHIHGIVRVKPSDTVVILQKNQASMGQRWVFQSRQRWGQLIDGVFDKKQAGLLRSFLLGERSDLDDSLEKAFVETGTMHLLVVSGFNVGLIAWIIEGLLRLFGMPWRARPWFAALAVWGYCMLTGMQPPVVRAGIMASVALGAIFYDRVVSWPNTLCIAALAMLMIDPVQLRDPSFQLSCGAVASLLVFTPRWQPVIENGFSWISVAFIRRWVVLSLAATAAVWAGLAPLLAWYFELVSPVSLIANLLIAPWVSLLVGLGTPLLFLSGFVCEPILHCAAIPLMCILKTIIFLVMICHHVPFGYFYVARPPLAAIIGYYCLVWISVNRAALRLSVRSLSVLWLIGLSIWAGSLAGERWYWSRYLRVDFLDVGHGDSVVIRTPERHVIIIDCGTQDAGRTRLAPFLRHEGVSTVDALVLTHTDEDHLGGAIPLMEAFRVKQLLTNGVHGDTMSAHRVRRLMAEKRIPEQALARGQRVFVEPEITLDVLHPPLGGVAGAKPKSNDNCLVLRLAMGKTSFLFTGDIEEAGLPLLMETGRLSRVTVLKVPHHGSRLGVVGKQFFEQVLPQVSIISAGRLHGLPSQQTIDQLRAVGSADYLTRQEGMISVRTDGRNVFMKTFHDGREHSLAAQP